ncbi:hypothetical protein GCM10027085_15170 [Spirosoma aerophilum]
MALEAAGLGTWELDLTTNQLKWDKRCQALFGLPEDTPFTYEDAIQFIHPDDTARVTEAIQWALNPASNGRYDVTYRTLGAHDGKLRRVRFTGKSYFTPSNQVYRFSGVAQAVDESEEHTESGSISAARLRSIIELAPVATCLFVGREMRIEIPNELMIRFFGRGPSIQGKPIREVLTKTSDKGAIQLLEQVFTTGEPFEAKAAPANLVIDGVAGTYFFDLSLKPLFNSAGQVDAILEMAVNVTPEVTARKKLQESEAYYRQIIDTVPAIIWETDPSGYCTYLNKQWYDTTGQTKVQAEGFGWLEACHPDDQAAVGRLFKEANERQVPFSALYRLRQENGLYRWSLDLGSPRFTEDGIYQGMIGTVVDVHEQTIARQALTDSEARFRALSGKLDLEVQQRTEELQASVVELKRSNDNLQQFAYVASHDLQEPLRKIQQFGDLLKDNLGNGLGESAIYLDRMQTAASRMSRLINDLLNFSRIAAVLQNAQTPVSLNQVVDTVLTDLEVVINETSAQVKVNPLPTVPGDSMQLGQLFQNLLSNALKFHQTGVAPMIEIKASILTADSLPSGVTPVRKETTYHQIEVIDNGIGFDEKYLHQLFQVFQRLHGRNTYAGTGIGLAICEKVVTNHGGAITASSRPGQGATFKVYLPVSDKA